MYNVLYARSDEYDSGGGIRFSQRLENAGQNKGPLRTDCLLRTARVYIVISRTVDFQTTYAPPCTIMIIVSLQITLYIFTVYSDHGPMGNRVLGRSDNRVVSTQHSFTYLTPRSGVRFQITCKPFFHRQRSGPYRIIVY